MSVTRSTTYVPRPAPKRAVGPLGSVAATTAGFGFMGGAFGVAFGIAGALFGLAVGIYTEVKRAKPQQ